jgi:hypothetical protein
VQGCVAKGKVSSAARATVRMPAKGQRPSSLSAQRNKTKESWKGQRSSRRPAHCAAPPPPPPPPCARSRGPPPPHPPRPPPPRARACPPPRAPPPAQPRAPSPGRATRNRVIHTQLLTPRGVPTWPHRLALCLQPLPWAAHRSHSSADSVRDPSKANHTCLLFASSRSLSDASSSAAAFSRFSAPRRANSALSRAASAALQQTTTKVRNNKGTQQQR